MSQQYAGISHRHRNDLLAHAFDRGVGVNYPPKHISCRSTVIPILDKRFNIYTNYGNMYLKGCVL